MERRGAVRALRPKGRRHMRLLMHTILLLTGLLCLNAPAQEAAPLPAPGSFIVTCEVTGMIDDGIAVVIFGNVSMAGMPG